MGNSLENIFRFRPFFSYKIISGTLKIMDESITKHTYTKFSLAITCILEFGKSDQILEDSSPA